MAPSRYDWKIVDWDVKPQHNQPTNQSSYIIEFIKWVEEADKVLDKASDFIVFPNSFNKFMNTWALM